jgi:eukaryotic-like serine/threonine-protein kinase
MSRDRIGRYRVVGRLGSGGTAEVYEGFDDELQRRVALKGLLADRAFPGRRERLRREALSAAALSHPAIAKVYETITEGDDEWVVMELVAGRSLAELLLGGPLPMEEVARIGGQVARGLAAAHDAGIIHRDIKTDNVMVTPGGDVKILDFGFAKWTRALDPGLARPTTDGVVVGTARAMSPEQATGRPLDYRTDIFSLGSLLYEMATGLAPFRSATTLETMYRVARLDYVPLRRVAPHLPKALVEIVERCLQKDPADRFATAGALADALHDVASPASGAANGAPTAAGSGASPWHRILRYWWVAAALAALAAVIVLAAR